MYIRAALHSAALFALLTMPQWTAAAEQTYEHATIARLTALQRGAHATLNAFPVGPTLHAPIRFERVPIYSDDAHLYAVTANGKTEVPRSKLIFLRGYGDDGSARVAMSLNPDATFAEGSGVGPEGAFVLHGSATASGGQSIVAQTLQSLLPKDFHIDFRCGNENAKLTFDSTPDIATQLKNAVASSTAATTAPTSLRLATVAVDTDNPFMLKLFNDDATSATNWIAGMFNAMNTMYERDLSVRLLVGTSYYQTAASDPYTSMKVSTFSLTAMADDLNIFSNYWKTNHPANSPKRAFAILLSGLQPSTANSCSASGIAWIDAFCQVGTLQMDGSTYGSYSVNQVCTSTNPFFGPSFSALLVGHELGHNFGAAHTHCTDQTSGMSNVASNTIDTCYNLESSNGCYGNATSCPTTGPGEPAGTIMSYCNVLLCGPDQQNVLQFHPTHISKVLLPAITAAPANCLNTTDDIFFGIFE